MGRVCWEMQVQWWMFPVMGFFRFCISFLREQVKTGTWGVADIIYCQSRTNNMLSIADTRGYPCTPFGAQLMKALVTQKMCKGIHVICWPAMSPLLGIEYKAQWRKKEPLELTYEQLLLAWKDISSVR